MRFDIILGRLQPDGDYTFDTVVTLERSRLAGEKEFTDKEVENRIYDNYDKIIWNTTPVLLLKDCITEWALYLKEQSDEYIDEKRRAEYGSWQEQMDMQYHDLKDGTTTWQTHIEAVKTDNPKL